MDLFTVDTKINFNTKEAARYLGVSVSTLYRMEKNKKIETTKTPGGQRRFNIEELKKYIKESKIYKAPQNPYKDKEMKNKEEILSNNTNNNVDPRNKLNELTGKTWISETKSVWYQKGLGSSHPHAQIEKQHPAPFSFQDISRLINFFTKPEQIVLDPFAGVASTMKACAILGRKGVGIELSEKWRNLGLERLKIEVGESSLETQDILLGDCREILQTFPDNYFDFIVTSPPYWNILSKKADHKVKQERLANNLATKYSDNVLDIGNLPSYKEFLDELVKIFFMCNRVLKLNKYIAIVVSDFRHRSEFVPFHANLIFRLTEGLDNNFFTLQGIKILAQNVKKLYPYGYPFAYVENIHHQYILILKKISKGK